MICMPHIHRQNNQGPYPFTEALWYDEILCKWWHMIVYAQTIIDTPAGISH